MRGCARTTGPRTEPQAGLSAGVSGTPWTGWDAAGDEGGRLASRGCWEWHTAGLI